MQTSYNQQIAAIKRAMAAHAVDSPQYLALNDAASTVFGKKIEEENKKREAAKIPNDLPEGYD